jgi:hypothetical protein
MPVGTVFWYSEERCRLSRFVRSRIFLVPTLKEKYAQFRLTNNDDEIKKEEMGNSIRITNRYVYNQTAEVLRKKNKRDEEKNGKECK